MPRRADEPPTGIDAWEQLRRQAEAEARLRLAELEAATKAPPADATE